MTLRVSSRSRAASAVPTLFLLILLPLVFTRSVWAVPFPGYTNDIRMLAERVVGTAAPGKDEALDRELRALREAMFEHGILSINAVPDRIFERAEREGWKDRAYEPMRAATRVAPLSIPLWAWLAWQDAARFRLERFFADIDGLTGAVRLFGPGLLGYAAWLFLFLSASACWFAAWSSINLLLRARPSLTSDIGRALRNVPGSRFLAPAAVLAVFVGPLLAGAGIGVAAIFWIALSAAYLRRSELLIAGVSILLLTGVFFYGGVLRSVQQVTGAARPGGWLGGEGYFPLHWPEWESGAADARADTAWSGMVRFAKARAAMQRGDLHESEALWSRLIEEGYLPVDSRNNRGIVRVRIGKTKDGIADFEEAAGNEFPPGPAHWNAYQLYLQEFLLDKAARIQPDAWAGIRRLSPFDYRAEEMTHGEMVASPLRVDGAWRVMTSGSAVSVDASGGGPFYHLFFRPVPVRSVPLFIFVGVAWASVWIAVSRKIWMHGTCRSCGVRSLIVGSREETDICTACRSGGGIVGIAEADRNRRELGIVIHRRFVKGCSVLFPGSGALWAGKGIRAMVYGLLLSLPAGLLTASFGAARTAGGLVGEMQANVWKVSTGILSLLWVIGIIWSWKSFDRLQRTYHLSAGGR